MAYRIPKKYYLLMTGQEIDQAHRLTKELEETKASILILKGNQIKTALEIRDLYTDQFPTLAAYYEQSETLERQHAEITAYLNEDIHKAAYLRKTIKAYYQTIATRKEPDQWNPA